MKTKCKIGSYHFFLLLEVLLPGELWKKKQCIKAIFKTKTLWRNTDISKPFCSNKNKTTFGNGQRKTNSNCKFHIFIPFSISLLITVLEPPDIGVDYNWWFRASWTHIQEVKLICFIFVSSWYQAIKIFKN